MTELELKPEHAADPDTRRVGILVGVVGIFLSVVTIASHRAHTDAVIRRTESNDQWTYYQAKKTRENTDEVALTLLQTLTVDPVKLQAPQHKLEADRERYAGEAKDIQKDARAKSGARCASTSGRVCWNSAWCCARCIFSRARAFFRSSACSPDSPAP